MFKCIYLHSSENYNQRCDSRLSDNKENTEITQKLVLNAYGQIRKNKHRVLGEETPCMIQRGWRFKCEGTESEAAGRAGAGDGEIRSETTGRVYAWGCRVVSRG